MSSDHRISHWLNELGSLLRSAEPREACALAPYPNLRGISFRQMCQLIETDPHRRVAPRMELQLADSDEVEDFSVKLDRLMNQLRHLDRAVECPVIAIAGLLNAGKSSLLASFLSGEGRKRVLIGSANDQGTHRFILWLPESWRKNPAVWGALQDQLATIFGTAAEELASDAVAASRQYNGDGDPNKLAVPLIATDEALDRLGVGLMDCPDIQTGWLTLGSGAVALSGLMRSHGQAPSDPGDQLTYAEELESFADWRLQQLQRAARLCSAFVVVVPSNAIQEKKTLDLLSSLQRVMPGVERIVAVNRVPRKYLARELADEVQKVFEPLGIERTYMAYHFDGPHARERLPPPPPMMHATGDQALPIFFQVTPGETAQPPEAIAPDRYLLALGEQTNHGQLVQDCRRSIAMQLNMAIGERNAKMDEFIRRRRARMQRLQQTLAQACFEFSAVRNASGQVTGLRLQASKEIVSQLIDSLEATAPWWAYPGRVVDRAVRSAREMVARSAGGVLPLRWLAGKAHAAVDTVREKMRGGEIGKVVSAQALVDELRRCDAYGDLFPDVGLMEGSRGAAELLATCQKMIDRFQAESQTRLPSDEIDRYTRELWSRMSWSSRLWTGIAPATLIFAPLLAVILIPIDFGGSSVLVFASIKELLLAAGLGAAALALQPGQMPKVAEEEAAWQQLCDLYAVGCDALGIPRPRESELPEFALGKEVKRLRPSQLPVLPADIDINTSIDTVALRHNEPIEKNPIFEERLGTLMERLLNAADGEGQRA